MFGFKSWTELTRPRDLAKIFDTIEYTKWRSFRESEDSRFVSLVMPRTLARLPYGAATKPIDEFGYEEGVETRGALGAGVGVDDGDIWDADVVVEVVEADDDADADDNGDGRRRRSTGAP